MKPLALLLAAVVLVSQARAEEIKKNIPYGDHERQVLDVFAPKDAKNLPVVFWIHGGGWQQGDKSDVQIKPKIFNDKGLVFVSTNYRLLPNVEMETIFRDIAKSIRWVHDHIAEYGGDPNRLLVMGHSAVAQLAALMCIDDRYLKSEGLSLAIIKGCVPVDGDTYDVPSSKRPRLAAGSTASRRRSSAIARSSATLRKSIRTTPPSPTWRRTKASRRS